MDVSTTTQAVLSWNINGGLLVKIPVIKGLLSNCDVLCLQEHFLTSHSLGLLKIDNNFTSYSVPAKRSASSGRPSGGIAMLVRTSCRSSIFDSCDFFLAVRVKEYVIVNVYLPTDYRNDRSEFLFTSACEKLGSCLSKIRLLGKCCIIIGDFNCNLTDASLLRTSILSGIFDDWLRILPKDLDYTYTHHSSHVSNLDHAVSSINLQVSPVHVVTDFQLSDHLPISASIYCSSAQSTPTTQPHQPHAQFYRDWENIQDDLFAAVTNSVLHKIHVPFQLLMENPQVDANEIRMLLDIYLAQICHALRCAEKASIPLKRIRRGVTKHWSSNPSLVEAWRKSKFWYHLWLQCDRPRSGWVSDIRLSTKRKFARELCIHMNQIVEETSQQASLSQPSFWRNVSRDPPRARLSAQVIPDSEWNSYFSAEFSPPDAALQSEYEDKLDKFLSRCPTDNFVVSADSVLRAIQRLKRKKSSGIDKISALHILHGSELLVNHIALLMQMIVTQGVVPSSFSIGDLTPIPKKGKLATQCSSFRPITVATTFCKLFELLFIDQLNAKCYVPPNQFGFQPRLGCAHALSVVANALIDADASGETLVLAGHDVRKAFDSLIHAAMLLHAAKRGVSPSYIRALRDMYYRLKVRLILHPLAKVDGSQVYAPTPNIFVNVEKGTRQGAVSSPSLFNNGVLDAQSAVPTSFIFAGLDLSLVCYADDILNVSRTIQRISEIFATLQSEYAKLGLQFNAEKSEVVFFNWKQASPRDIPLGNSRIKPVDHITYLGLPIGSSVMHTRQLLIAHIERRVGLSYASFVTNKLRFNRHLLSKLFNSVALPHYLYISPFWKMLTNSDKSKIRSVFFRFAKYLLRFPSWTRNSYLIRKFSIADPIIAVEKQIRAYNSRLMKLNHPWSSVLTH